MKHGIGIIMLSIALLVGLSACSSNNDEAKKTDEQKTEIVQNNAEKSADTKPEQESTNEYIPEGELGFAEQGLLTNLYVDPKYDFTMQYDGSWLANEEQSELNKGVSVLYYRSAAAVPDECADNTGKYFDYVKENVIAQDVVKDIEFVSRQDEKYFFIEYKYVVDDTYFRWSVICDPSRQISLLFQFMSADENEFEKLLPEVDELLKTVDIKATLGTNVASKSSAGESTKKSNVSSDGKEVIGKWGQMTDGQKNVQLDFRADGSYSRYKSMEDSSNCIKGKWEYSNGLLYIHNEEAVLDSVESDDFSREVVYEIVEYNDGKMTLKNVSALTKTTYEALDD